MTSPSNVSISLQSQLNPSGMDANKPNENNGLMDSPGAEDFEGILKKAQAESEVPVGKQLPQEGEMTKHLTEVASESELLPAQLEVRQQGSLKLITTPEAPVSETSLIEFMQEQGFSRAEMAELLIAQSKQPVKSAHEVEVSQVALTNQWLRLKADGSEKPQSVESAITKLTDSEPMNLARALAEQIMSPKAAMKTSVVTEVLVSKEVLSTIKLADSGEKNGEPIIRLADLIPGLKRTQSSTSGNGSGDTNSGSFGAERESLLRTEQTNTQSQNKEFREFLADHLKRAESLREMTDRLGSMIARQIAGQIGRGRWSLEMAMHPAELGSIEIEMEMTERGLEASFRASHSVTRDLLMESMPRLKSWFEEGGIDVAYAGLAQDSGAQNGGNPTGQNHDSRELGKTSESEESADLVDNTSMAVDSDRLDVRV